MKRILLLLLLAATFTAKAQSYNNEWIDYSKTYYKFRVGSNNVFRIRQATLASLGLSTVNADHFQLWRNGEQVPIYTSVQNAPLGSSDYIEFWGMMNDGKPDHPLYREPEYQLSDKWSLQTDTAAYFLTVNLAGSNARIEATNNNVAGNTLPADLFFMYTLGKYPKDKIHGGRAEIVGDSYTYSASYDKGEGWSTSDIGTEATYTTVFNNAFVYSGTDAPAPVFKINAAGNAVHARDFLVKLNGDSIAGSPLNYYETIKLVQPLNIAQINATNLSFAVTNHCAEANDRMVIAQIELEYPRRFNFGDATNFPFELPANPNGNYLEIAGFNNGGTPPVVYDLTNGKRYIGDISTPSLIKVALLPSSVNRKLVLVSQATSNIQNATIFEQRNFIDYSLPANQGNYLIITSSLLAGPSNGVDPVEDYRQYRSSPVGGSFNAKVYLVNELIDQFAYGIKMHPLSIRNFLRFARRTYSIPLKDILLIGKGVTYDLFKIYEADQNMAKLCLVPTFGNPASDILLSAEGNSSVPLTPVGRLSVIERSEISVYLDKLKKYEQTQRSSLSPLIADMAWRKNVVHVTGASDDVTTQILQTANNGYKRIIEDTLYGGKVYSFTKNSSASVEQLTSSQLGGIFAEGLSILTYFGHSSASTLEFNLENPQNYNNPGKYPIFIVMGCNAGNFFSFNTARFFTKETISERYLLAPERGSIAFLASTGLGIVHYLDIYNTHFYEATAFRKYGGAIGELMDDAINQVFASTTENDFYARFQCEEFTLHGDPAIRMNAFPKPDYVVEDQLVKVSPSFISVADTSFKVDAKFMNIGMAVNKKVVIELKRTYPDQSVTVIRDTIEGIRYADSLIYNLPILGGKGKGLNKITITIDPDNEVDESFETNNSISKDVYIFEDELRPIYPYNFSILHDQNLTLVASTANTFAESRDYLMEMDTTELFNSPSKITRTTTTVGGIVEFTPGITFADSTVYYWRVAPYSPTGDLKWNVFSFVYISGSEDGFNQSHLYQLFKNKYERITLDSTSRKFSFGTSTHNMFVRSGVFPTGFTQAEGFALYMDDDPAISSVCGVSNIVFNVVDPITFKAWYNGPPSADPGQFGSDPVCGGNRSWNFQFNILDPNKRKKIIEFLDMIPDGYYVVARNCSGTDPASNTYASDWQHDAVNFGTGNTIYDRLKDQGFAGIDSFYRPRAFVFMYRKNMASEFEPRYTFSDGLYDAITLSVNVITPDTLGIISSPVFGPARGWKQLHWRGSISDPVLKDNPKVDIYGVDNNGVETPLMTNIDLTNQDYDISSINVAEAPYLRIKMRNMDSIYRTPYQLRYWMVTYNPVPEGAIAPNLYFTSKDTVEVGEPVNFGIGFKNISSINFDSLNVKMVIKDQNNVDNIVPIPKQKDLATGDTIKLNVPIDTRSLSGTNTVFLNFNPDYDQPEQYLYNNYVFRTLYVRPDSLNPLLDVTFDGTHILNRDIVSSKPAILIKLKDEAKWMMLDDTSLVGVSVRYPDGIIHQYSFINNNDTLQFIPAGQAPNTNNAASVNFNPYFTQDGDYELVVTGKDRSGNSAGTIAYRVAFTVINKPMISNLINYPNPFTTSTAFVFTITGSQVPQNLRIQILTITGKIVREIKKEELGPIRIGRNITEFKWDGTDQYGDKLANGIYLYRVITNLNGKSLDKYKAQGDNTDKYFNNGYGKMYLMR